jgi:hypothetical protein
MIPTDYADVTDDVTTRGRLLASTIRQHVFVSRSLDWASPEFQILRDDVMARIGEAACSGWLSTYATRSPAEC